MKIALYLLGALTSLGIARDSGLIVVGSLVLGAAILWKLEAMRAEEDDDDDDDGPIVLNLRE